MMKNQIKKILLLNVPHLSIGSRIPNEHLPPLGLLSIGGPLIDAGFKVKLLDAEFGPMNDKDILSEILAYNPDFVMMGHSGSTSAQPIINRISNKIKELNFAIKIIVGGVFPSFHYKEIMTNNPQIDFIVRGEGEKIITNLIAALTNQTKLEDVNGIVFRNMGKIIETQAESLICNLDDYRIAWELMQNYNYRYWGNLKAVVIQFSRGCPYPCTYCGQSIFWKKFRNRNPQKLADEIEMLHKKYGIQVVNFADENPSSNKIAWKEFLEAMIAKKLNIKLVASIRADNIVRDAEILSLYKQAGFERFLIGIENYDQKTLQKIKKTASQSTDMLAIKLLRKNNIISMATYVVGFGEERIKDFFISLKQLLLYDPDQIQLMYVTPHQWTPYFKDVEDQRIIQIDQRKWDYKHQVMEIKNLKPWLVIFMVKLIEIILQTRPKALKRLFFHRDKEIRKAMFWYTKIGRKVWFYEWFQFLFIDKHEKNGIKLGEFWK